jgi:THO complex subunit 4
LPKNAAKAQPKPATANKANDRKGSTRGRGGKTARGRNAGRGKPKSAEELDLEMADYFNGGAGDVDAMVTNGGAVQAPTGGDTGMDDEILVSTYA